MKPIRLASLFSGIGGFELGLSWSIANLEIVWQVEIDAYCRQVLKKHFPESTQYEDIKTFDTINQIDTNIHILVGGFPCQDISIANSKRSGLDGKKSGLFWEMLRVIKSLRVPIVVMENVAALLIPGGGMGTVLREMDKIGYRVEWFCMEAKDFGLPHKRRRVFIVCYATDTDSKRPVKTLNRRTSQTLSNGNPLQRRRLSKPTDTNGTPIERNRISERVQEKHSTFTRSIPKLRTRPEKTPPPEPTICRMDDGIPAKLHNNRLKALGNSIVPQKTEWIGRRLLESGLIRDILGEEYVCESF